MSLFNRMSRSRREAESYEIDADNTRLCDLIATKVSDILLKELLDIIGQITDRLIVKLKKRMQSFGLWKRFLRRQEKEILMWRSDKGREGGHMIHNCWRWAKSSMQVAWVLEVKGTSVG